MSMTKTLVSKIEAVDTEIDVCRGNVRNASQGVIRRLQETIEAMDRKERHCTSPFRTSDVQVLEESLVRLDMLVTTKRMLQGLLEKVNGCSEEDLYIAAHSKGGDR